MSNINVKVVPKQCQAPINLKKCRNEDQLGDDICHSSLWQVFLSQSNVKKTARRMMLRTLPIVECYKVPLCLCLRVSGLQRRILFSLQNSIKVKGWLIKRHVMRKHQFHSVTIGTHPLTLVGVVNQEGGGSESGENWKENCSCPL